MTMEDRDVPDKEWREYLRKYASSYRMEKQADGNWVIRCRKGGHIYLFSLYPEPRLGYFYQSPKVSAMEKGYALSRVKGGLPEGFLHQEGDTEFSFHFPESSILRAEPPLFIRKKRILSDIQKAAMVATLKAYREGLQA